MAWTNLLVDWMNSNSNIKNLWQNVQKILNKSAANMNNVQTPNLPTKPTTNVTLRKAAQPVQTTTPVQTTKTTTNLNTNIVQPVQTNTTAGGVWTVAPEPQQSRFIGLQQQPTWKSMAGIVKSTLYIPTAWDTAWKANKKEENKFRTTEQALLDFQADVLKKKGKMKDADIKRLYPEFADQLDVMKELQTELRPIVKNWQGVDGEQLAQYYPELIQPKNLQDVEAIKKQSDTSNKKLQSNIQKVEKVVTENFDVLSPDWQKYVQDYLTLAWVIDSLKKNYRIVWGANDDEILQYAIENNPQLKWVADELQRLKLSEMDKATIDWNSLSIITSMISGLQKMTRQASNAVQNFAAEQNYLAEQSWTNQPNFFNTTWNTAANILWAADQTTTAAARFFWNQNVQYELWNKEAQEAVEKQEVSDLLAMWWWYWKTVWGIATAPFEYWKLNPITKPVVEWVVEPVFEWISDLEKTITNPVWDAVWFNEQDKENADAILLWEIFRESKNVKKDVKVRADAAKDIVSDAFKKTVKSNKRSEMKKSFEEAWVYDKAWYIKPEARTQAAKIIAKEFAKDFTENFKNDAKQWGDVVDFYRKKEWVKSYKEQINDIKEWAKEIVDTGKDLINKGKDLVEEWINKWFDKMDESIERWIDNLRNKVTREKTTEIKTEETAPIKDTAWWSQPKKWVVSKVVWWVTAIWNKINEKVVDPLSTKVAEWITSTTAPQDKLFKALNPSINVLSRKKWNYDTIRKNADRANELIVEYGDTPTNSKDYYDSIVNTKKKIWNNWIQQGLDEYKYTTIDAKDLINPVREALKEFTAEPLEALKGDAKKLEAELQAIESKGIISLLEMETKKRQINAILEYWLPPDASQIYEKWMRELNRQIWIQEDRMISELPWEFSKFKRDYGALTAIEEDAQKLMIKDMKKKLWGNLIQNWSRIEGLGKMGKAIAWKGSFLEWAAQIILWESLGKVKDTNFLIKSWFEGLRGQYKWGTTKPEWVKIKKKPPTPRLEDKRTDVEKWKLLEIDKRTKSNREEWYKTKNAVTSEKSAVTEKKPTPKKEEVEKKETPKAEKDLETRVETKKPEPKQDNKAAITEERAEDLRRYIKWAEDITYTTVSNEPAIVIKSRFGKKNEEMTQTVFVDKADVEFLKDEWILSENAEPVFEDFLQPKNKVTAQKTQATTKTEPKQEDKSGWNAFGLKEQKGSSRINNFTNVIKKIVDKYQDKIEQSRTWIIQDKLYIEKEPREPLEITLNWNKDQLMVRHIDSMWYDDPAILFNIQDWKLHAIGVKLAFMEQLWNHLWSRDIKDTDELLHTRAVNLEDQFLGERNIDEDTGVMREKSEWESELPTISLDNIKNAKSYSDLMDLFDKSTHEWIIPRSDERIQYKNTNYVGKVWDKDIWIWEHDNRTAIAIWEWLKKTEWTDNLWYERPTDIDFKSVFDIDDIKNEIEKAVNGTKTTTAVTWEKAAVTSKKVEKPENKWEQPAKSPVNELLEKNWELEYYIWDKFMTYRYPWKSLYTAEWNPIMEGENVRMIPITQWKEILEKQIEKAFDNWFKMQVTNGEEINWQIYDHIERFDWENGEPVIEFYRTAKHGDEFDYVWQYWLKEFLNEYWKDIKNLQATKSETIQSKPKNLVTNKSVDNSSITWKFRNLTLDDYKKMQQIQWVENQLTNWDLEWYTVNKVKAALLDRDNPLLSDAEIDENELESLEYKDIKKAIDTQKQLQEEEAKLLKANPENLSQQIEDLRYGYDEEMLSSLWIYNIEDTDKAVNAIKKIVREAETQFKKDNEIMKPLVEKYGKWWEQWKSVAKSENQNIIGKNNSLTTKNNSNGQITNEQRLWQTNQPNWWELRNEVSNMQSVEWNKAWLQGVNNTNGDRQLTTSGEQDNIRWDGLTAWHESTKLTVGQQRKVNEDTRAILEKHNFSTSRSDYTPEELETLFKYEWNGGLAKAWDENVKGTRYEYYTPKNAVQALQRWIQMYSDSPIESVEDPTAWKWNMVDWYGENVDKYMYEISPISWTIAKLRFPEAKVWIGEKDWDFQRRYLNYQWQKAYDTPRDWGHNVDAILLNPPFWKRITIKDEPQIKALEDYFTKRSIEHDLKDWGVVWLLMPSRWLKADDSYTKKRLDYNTKIMDAYRLPAWVFSYTDVGTDLIILKKVTWADNQWGFINDNYFKQNPDKVLWTEEVRSGRHGLETYIKWDAAVIDKLRQDTDIAPTPMNKVTWEWTKTAITTKTTTVENKPKNIVTSESFKPETATEKKTTVEKKVPVKKGSKILKETVTKWDKTDVGTFTVNGNETAYKYQAATDADGFVDSRLSWVPVSAVMWWTDLLNYIDWKVQTDYLYFSWDIYAKLEQLEKDKDVLSPEQYQKQKDWLLNVLPEKLTVKDIQWSPSDKELMKQESDIANWTTGHRRRYGEYWGLTERNLTIKELFEDYLDALPREAFQGTDTSRSKIMDFVNWKAITFGQLRREYWESDLEFKQRQKAKKAENEIKRQATKERAKTFFNDFVNDSLSPEIQEKIAEWYNTRLRAVVKPDYKNMPLQLENMSATFKWWPLKLDPVQVEWINAMLSKGTMLIAHWVGYWKTLEWTCATIESIQRGRCKRPLFIVPNGTKKDWISTIHDSFPWQEIVDLWGLRVDDIKRLRKDLWNDTTQWIKDWQVGIITHSWFNWKLSFKKATQEDIQWDLRDVMWKQDSSAREEDALEENIQNIAETLNKKQETKKTSTAKALLSERYGDELLEQLDANMEDMNEAEFTKYFVELANWKYPENELIQDAQTMYLTKPVYVEDLGIDHITIDEVHKYKNIFTSAKLSKKWDKGKKWDEVNPYWQISGSSAPKSRKMFALSQYILKNNNGRWVFSLTATPFNNQPIEVYNMLSLHAYNRLVEKGIQNINSFFDMFANFRQEWISKPLKKWGWEFGLVMKDFSNLPEMQRLIGEYIDYVWDNPNLVRPEKRTKKVILTPSALQKQIQEMLQAKEAQISAWWGKETVLPLYSEMRQNIISPYITNYAQNALPTPTWKEFIDASPKLKFAVDTIKALRDEWRKDWVFIYMPKWVEFHNLLKQAIEESVGRDRVKVWIINWDTKGTVMVDWEPVEKDIAIADQFRNGELNVLIWWENTTEWINLQDNWFITINTLIWWNPTEITQLNGRVWRQWNLRDHVIELLPLLTDWGDIMMMQKYDEKSNRINNIFESQGRVFNLEEIDPEEEKMALMTDPKRKAELSVEIDKKRIDKEIQKLSSQNGTLKEIQQKMPKEEEVKALQEKIEKKQAELKELNDTMKTLNPENAAFGSLAVQADYVARDIKSDKEQLKKLEKNKARAESRMENYAIESIEWVNQRINENDAKMDELIETKKNIDSEMPDRIAKFTKEYEEWKSNMKTPEEYIDDLKEDFRSLKVFENREQLKAHLDEKKTQKNNVIATDKNRVTSWKTMAASARRPSITMKVDDREEKNVVKPTKEVKPQVEQKDIKGKMYHVTTADFENFRESDEYNEEDRMDWNDSYWTYVTDAQQFFDDFMETSYHNGDWRKLEVDVDIKKAALHPYRTWKEFGVEKADEMIMDWLQLVDRWTPEIQKELVALKNKSLEWETGEEFDYDSYPFKDSYTKEEILKMPWTVSSAILDAQFVGEWDIIIDYLRWDHAAEDRETLKKKWYDAVMIYEWEKDWPIYSYALFYPNKYKKNVVANDKNKVTSSAMRAYRPQITMKLDDNGNPVKKNKITKQPVQNAPMKFSSELVSKIDKLAEERWLEWNTIKKMKVLNKEVDKWKWYQTETEKEIYNLKKQIIIEYLKAKWKTIKDKWQKKTIVDIKQWKTRVHWHVVGKLYRDLKREWIIK